VYKVLELVGAASAPVPAALEVALFKPNGPPVPLANGAPETPPDLYGLCLCLNPWPWPLFVLGSARAEGRRRAARVILGYCMLDEVCGCLVQRCECTEVANEVLWGGRRAVDAADQGLD